MEQSVVMKRTQEQLNKKFKVYVTFVGFVVAAVTIISASVAWMNISRTPIVSDLGLTVLTENRLEIAPDENGSPGEWDVVLDLSTILENVAPLKTVTYSQSRGGFYAMSYGLDGRAAGATVALTDAQHANVRGNGSPSGTTDGYYIAIPFWLRAPSTAVISLSEAKEVEEGLAGTGTYVIGNPVWNGSAVIHENGGNGLETAIRIGLQCQTTDLEGNPQGGSRFIIYEPNADTHVDGTTGYLETPSIDGGASLIGGNDLIWQTTSTWNETTPVLSSNVLYQMGQFQTGTDLFTITPSTMQKITLYVWLEGQDVDCVNAAAGVPTSILANLQFTTNEQEMNTGIHRDN